MPRSRPWLPRATAAAALLLLLAQPGRQDLSAAELAPAPAPAPRAEPQYRMTSYFVGFLRKGPTWTAELTPEVEKLQAGHMANIQKMADSGKLKVAGPFSDGGDLRGMFIFHGATEAEIKEMVARDPAVQAGRLIMELHPWYAAAGLRVDSPEPATPPPAGR